MNILLTSVGRRTYLVNYFKEALGKEGKIYASNSAETLATKEADGYLITPLIYDEQYIPTLLEYCLKNNITTLLSVFDIDLLVLSKNIKLFAENGITVLLANEKEVEICNDKWETYLFLKENNIKTPKTYLSVNSTIDAISKEELSYPIIIKPRWGMASMGIYIVDTEEELIVLSKKCQKDISKTHLKYESSFTPDDSIIYQEVLLGQEYGLDVINDLEGNYVKTFAKKKVLMRAGETDLGETVSSTPFEEVALTLGNKISQKTILSVDCFDVDGEIYVIEMNCRISGHYPVSHVAGVNLPKQIIKWLKGEETDMDLFNIKEGIFVCKDLIPTEL